MATKRPYIEGGKYVAKARHTAGLSQYELSRRLGFKYYSYVSQVETGVARVPVRTMSDWAKALNVDPATFAKALLRAYDRPLFDLLFPEKRR